MRTQTETEDRAAAGEAAPPRITPRADFTPVAMPPEGAQNDGAYDGAPAEEHELAVWARRAFAANGLADDAIGPAPAGDDMLRVAQARRADFLGDSVVATIKAVSGFVQQAYARFQRARRASDIYDALRQLDDTTLRDLGFDRSELRSVAIEAAAQADDTSTNVPAERLRTQPVLSRAALVRHR